MRIFHRIVFPLIPLLLMLSTPVLGQIEGVFEAIGPIPEKHSLDVVQLEEFLNFTCPHCNNFRKASKPVFEKYGKRLQTTNIPVLFRGQIDVALRLYYIAEKFQRHHEVKTMIFEATFLHGVDINDPRVIGFLASSAGLAEEFRKELVSPWVYEKIKSGMDRADKAGVRATPTIVLNGSIRLVPEMSMEAFVKNLDRIVGQLLKKEE